MTNRLSPDGWILLALALLGAAAFAFAPSLLRPFGLFLLSSWAVTSIAAVGLNLTLGYAGQISMAQAAFVGIGAYVVALLQPVGVPFGACVILAMLACFAIGWALGYPALRVQHHYLAFVTLAFGTLVYLVFRNEEWLTGGIYGINAIARPKLFGYSLNTPAAFFRLCLAALAIVMVGFWWLVRSPWGRAFVALRENPIRALSLGVDTRRYTLMAFAIGSALGGLSGAFYAPLVQYVEPTPFALGASLNLVLMVIIGGSGRIAGPLIGALISILLPEWLRFTEGLYLLLYAIAVMVMMALCPTGIIGLLERVLAPKAVRV